MNMTKGLLYLSVFLMMSALACKSTVDRPEPVGVWQKSSNQAQNENIGTLELKDDSIFIFTASSKGHSDSTGRYSLTEDHITFEDDTCYTPGTYTYDLENDQLTFELISDSCEMRANALSGTWSRQPLE